MNITQRLQELGLRHRQADVYLAVLALGSGSALQIATRVGIPRTTAHEILQGLLQEGFVFLRTKGRTRIYGAESPQHLKRLFEEKQQKLLTLLPELESLRSTVTAKPVVRFYEGIQGIKAVFEDTLTSQDKILRGLLSMEDLYHVPGKVFMDHYVKRRVEAGLALRVIRSEQKEVAEVWASSRAEKRELHYAPKEMIFPMTLYLYDQKVAIIGTDKERFGMIIQSADFYQMQKNFFEVLWQVTRVGKRID